ncbi:PREDICTED: pyroglutamyl-peptidase 1-like protein isoform X3 [Gekko japonicus]|uniref:Pyroglutamyl-peptidase 1-like protein isoform X3 n=1 Tax=Gekko japonicus TaxID=146911 RepID=A0ABM1L251_GEKJA|nr:PREDICTED: pyroglutamyl-peptidase 1-like protein isoform X3 [Gekko japonicus]
MDASSNTVVVTGFGPFRQHLVNSSWAAVKLVIHVGLASASRATILLEQCGKNKGYKERDVCGFLPEDGCCVSEGPERIESTINMKRVWKNLLTEGIDAVFSRDAGRYVCDYTYYTSLYYGNGRAAFIHVPPLSKWVTAEFLGRTLQRVILEMLKQCKQENRERSKGEPLEDEQEDPWKK